jgi:glutaredoxin 2
VVWWLVYIVLASMRASKNQRIAEEIEEKAGQYCRKKEECKGMVEQVREHLNTLQQTVRKYEVLLAEKNAGLRRAIFIEEAESFDDLHDKSQVIAREIEMMIKELERLLTTPMAKAGALTDEAVEALRHAKRVVNDQILRLYN